MNKGISDFTLRLIFRDWGFHSVFITGLGIAAAIIAHQQTEWWTLIHTIILIFIMALFTIIRKCVVFAYELYKREFPRLQAKSFIKGDGLNSGSMIITLSYAEGFSKGQLLTLYCESSGAKQPILVIEIIEVNNSEIQAISITNSSVQNIKKYFDEESRRKMLFAESKVTSSDISSQTQGDRNG